MNSQGTRAPKLRFPLSKCVPKPQIYPIKARLGAVLSSSSALGIIDVLLNRCNVALNTSHASGMVQTIHCKLQLNVSSNWYNLTWPFSYSLDKRRKRQASSQGGRLDTNLGGAQVHGNLKKKQVGRIVKRTQGFHSLSPELPLQDGGVLRVFAHLFLTDARGSSANKTYDRQNERGSSLQTPSSTASCSPADAFAIKQICHRGTPCKTQSLQRGLLHLLPESQQTKGPHLSSAAGADGHRWGCRWARSRGRAPGRPLLWFHRGETRWRAFPTRSRSSRGFLTGKRECFPSFPAAASESAAAPLKPHPFECSARI